MPGAFDYVIVGAGSAGCALAARLSEDPTTRVLLLEAGGEGRRIDVALPMAVAKLWPNPNLTWGYQTEPEPELLGRRLPVARGKMLGGTSALNGMMAIRGHAADYDAWAAQGLPGWDWAGVLPYFKKLERHWRGDTAEHGGQGPVSVEPHPAPSPLIGPAREAAKAMGFPLTDDFNGAATQGFGMPDFTIRNGRRASTARAYLDQARKRPNLAIETDALVERVTFEGSRATGVQYRKHGESRHVTANREVILAAGAIASPQLLLLSGIGPASELQHHNIPVVADRAEVGRNLMDHPGCGLEMMLDRRWAFEENLRFDRLARAFLNWGLRGKGPMGAPPLAISANVASVPGDPAVDLHFLLVPLAMESKVWFPLVRRRHGPRLSAMWSLNYPKSRGSLSLASADPAGHPAINLALLSDERDRAAMVHGYRVLRELLHQPSLAAATGEVMTRPVPEPHSDDEILAYVRANAMTAYHPSGTCRMGGDEAAVVDGELRVRGVDALRVIDASVFPLLPGGNTNLPVIMVAEKGADLIKAG